MEAAPRFEALLQPRPEGLYCPPGGFHVDPVRPVERAVITHGHADHARAGHAHVLATPATLDIMRVRYGEDFAGATQALPYGERVGVGSVDLRLVPAGHVLGSAQAVIAHKGCTAVVSGDYKRRRDPTCAGFEPVPCDLFISEATFGLPVFRHPPDGEEVAKLLESLRQFPERTHIVGAYALGKAQRVIALLREAGYDRPIYVHGALLRLNALYAEHGIDLGDLRPATPEGEPGKRPRGGALSGEIVVAPPSAVADRWSRRFADPVDCFASGWMRVRGRARQRGVELPLILSDHADWDELTATVAELSPRELWVTHGREEALVRWCELHGHPARALRLVGYEDDELD